MEACAREAGVLTRQHFGRAVKTWSKGAAGPVTEIDLKVDDLLKEKLRAARPDYGWFSEETEDTNERLFATRVWVVDPIDGTEAFIKGVPQYTISIGLVENGEAIAGAVYNPMTDEMFIGARGAPAMLNGRIIRASQRSQLEGARFIGQERMYQKKRWREPWPHLQIEWRHSIAYRLALVAAGQYDATILLGFKHDWDVAGGAAILEAAGATVSATTGEPLKFNEPEGHTVGAVAAGPNLHPLIIERVQQLPHPKDWGKKGWKIKWGEGA